MPRGRAKRAAIYAGVGFVTEAAFSALHDVARGRKVRFRTSPWMLPIYALVQPLYEPMHERFRAGGMPAPVRAAAYGAGFLTVEYATGAIHRRTRGTVPWDYSDAPRNVDGLIRLDYFFLWAAAGLALEPLHDRLIGPPLVPHSGGVGRACPEVIPWEQGGGPS